MNKFLPLALCFTVCAWTLTPHQSQAQAFEEGHSYVSVGYGFITFLGVLNKTFDVYDDVTYRSLGPIYLKYEYAVTDNIGVGLNFAYATNEWEYRYNPGFDNNFYTESTLRSTYSILARINFHLGDGDKFDPYIGYGIGYRDATWSTSSTDPLGTGSGFNVKGLMPLGMELTFGARYMFTDNIGLYAELGAAKSIFQGGLTIKI
jgi:opacity protein-like surface antigen